MAKRGSFVKANVRAYKTQTAVGVHTDAQEDTIALSTGGVGSESSVYLYPSDAESLAKLLTDAAKIVRARKR